ncbi:hypothetical protein GSS88_09240 [Corynebacterium sp. 3HC-13]|uniref:hypothetical protein n=1 Tax=Corynebacterium poyangense TaxID=2684405 RepID=UPI001CCDDC33|nr:hypothetical protein [Corynebacterium poyangense]MBZ8177967.1 hypothetical protein [Corynebacterium poyangense]
MLFISDLQKIDSVHSRDLYRLRWASIIGSFGNGLTGVVLTIAVASSLGGTGTSVALTSLAVGMLLSFAAGGVHADHGSRVGILVKSDLLRGIANLLVLAGILVDNYASLPLILLGCFTNGMCAGYFRPALASLWAELVPASRLKDVLATNFLLIGFPCP